MSATAAARAPASVEEVAVPSGSLAARAFAVTHHADAFRIALPAGATHDIDALTLLLVSGKPPWWVETLGWLRNRAVAFVGLRSTAGSRRPRVAGSKFAPGEYAGMFRVFDRSDDEILMGLDDRHLNFRASLLVQRDGDRRSAVLSTVVHYNSRLGRVYFFFVRPFHRLIVRAMLRRLRSAADETPRGT